MVLLDVRGEPASAGPIYGFHDADDLLSLLGKL
jgi:hypothetical protein